MDEENIVYNLDTAALAKRLRKRARNGQFVSIDAECACAIAWILENARWTAVYKEERNAGVS